MNNSSRELTKSDFMCDNQSTPKGKSSKNMTNSGADKVFAYSENTLVEFRQQNHNCSATTSQIFAN